LRRAALITAGTKLPRFPNLSKPSHETQPDSTELHKSDPEHFCDLAMRQATWPALLSVTSPPCSATIALPRLSCWTYIHTYCTTFKRVFEAAPRFLSTILPHAPLQHRYLTRYYYRPLVQVVQAVSCSLHRTRVSFPSVSRPAKLLVLVLVLVLVLLLGCSVEAALALSSRASPTPQYQPWVVIRHSCSPETNLSPRLSKPQSHIITARRLFVRLIRPATSLLRVPRALCVAQPSRNPLA